MSAEMVEKIKSEMSAGGLSSGAIDGILKIAGAYKPKDGEKPDMAQAMVLLKKLLEELDGFIKTQSPADQTAFAAILEKKKADFAALIKK